MEFTVKHSLPGRIRVCYDKQRITRRQAALAQSLLSVQEGMNSVSVNYITGSFLLYYDTELLSEKKIKAYFMALSDKYLGDVELLNSVEEPQEQSYVTDTEPQEQEREEPNTKDFLINYLVTVYYVDGHSSFRSFSGCADGIVFNFQQNSLHLDDLENGNRSVFNMFNFPDSEEIVACDVSFTLIPYLPF